MISPYTIPGTKIICIDSGYSGYSIPGHYYTDTLDGLTEGEVYTVKEIRPESCAASGFCVVLEEIHRPICLLMESRGQGFDLGRFKKLELPKCIIELLNTENAPNDLKEECDLTTF